MLFVVVTSGANAGLPDPHQAPASAAGVWVPPSGLQQIAIWPNGAPDRSKRPHMPETVQIKQPPEVAPGREYTQILDAGTPGNLLPG